MRQVDEIHQPERDGETAGQHEQQHAVGDAVEQNGEQRGHEAGLAEISGIGIATPGNYTVMAGLVPAIHVFLHVKKKGVDARHICAKTRFAL
jgi:hypothetical protein